jgi:hypothetical protein
VWRRGSVLSGLLFVATFGVYWATLAGGVLGGDAGELQFVPPILGLTHPTGYPLQVLLHKAWTVIPGGSVAYRLNLLDAGIAAAAVSLVAACGRRLAGRWLPGLVAAATFAFGELWWSQAVSGDKYTLNGLFLALVLLLFMTWRSERDERWLRALALAYGLSLTHHRSMVLVAPALALGLWLEGWRPRGWGEPLRLLGLAATPLSLYLYVPWAGARGLPPGSWPVDTPDAFVEYLLDRGYTSQIRPDASLVGRLAEEGAALLRSFGPLGVLLGLLGLARTAVRDRQLAAVLVAAFIPQAVLGASYVLESNYALPRHWVFYLPAFLLWSLWVASGVDAVQRAGERLSARRGGPGLRTPRLVTTGGLVAAVVLAQGATVWARSAEGRLRAQLGAETLDAYRQDLQRSPLAERFGRLAFELAEPNAILVCDWEQATVLWYFQRVEGWRPDVEILYPIERLDEGLASARRDGRPLYVARVRPGLAERALPSSVGPLVRLLPAPEDSIPSDAVALDARLEDGVTLAGVSYHASDLRAGGVLPMTLHWRVREPADHDYSVSVRLLAPDGRVLAQHDERHPALGTAPTSTWPVGPVVGDYHELPLGNRLQSGAYRVGVVAYRPDPLRNLRLVDRDGRPGEELIRLPPFELRGREPGLLDLVIGRARP